jgi:hypothetical protein
VGLALHEKRLEPPISADTYSTKSASAMPAPCGSSWHWPGREPIGRWLKLCTRKRCWVTVRRLRTELVSRHVHYRHGHAAAVIHREEFATASCT